jgi:hypothetical protein
MSAKDFLEKQMLVLNEIASLVGQQKANSPISLTYLLENTTLQEEEVKEIVSLLEKEGDITVTHPSQRVSLIQPLSAGYKKISAWEEKNAAQKPKKRLLSVRKTIGGSLLVALLVLLWWWLRLPSSTTEIVPLSATVPMLLSVGKIIGGSLLAALLLLFWWWLGLSPSTTKIVPRSATVPIRLYHTAMFPTNVFAPNGLYHFPNAPKSLEPVFTKDAEETQELVEKIDIDYTPVTLDGFVKITLDVESVAQSYQVNITSLQVAVVRNPTQNPENLYLFLSALGGGATREYELLLSTQSKAAEDDGVVYYQATLNPDDPSIDYIYVKPGERETLEISIQLDRPGIFELTPIVHYSYRDKKNTVEADRYQIVYPDKYRIWAFDTFIRGEKKCQNGGGILQMNGIIVSTQSKDVIAEFPVPTQKTNTCFSEPKWIAFESASATFGHLRRLYIVDTNGENFREVDSTGIVNYPMDYRYLAWRDDGHLVFGKTYYDYLIDNQKTEYFVVDPVSLEREAIEDYNRSDVVYDNSNLGERIDHWESSPSADGQWILSGGDKLSIMRADGSCSQDILLPPFSGISNWLLQP